MTAGTRCGGESVILPATVHASAVIVGESGILVRGLSGAGKSSLVRALLQAAARDGRFARLIGDDRVWIVAAGGQVLVRPHESIAGLIEVRGQGIAPLPHEGTAVLRCVVDLVAAETVARMPENDSQNISLGGIRLPRLMLPAGQPAADAAADVLAFLDRPATNATK